MNSLRKRLILSYILVAVICVFLISILANFFLEKQFRNYVIKSHNRKSNDITRSITDQYRSDGKWNYVVMERIGIDALEGGLIISITDNNGSIIWDATVHNNGRCQALIAHMSHNMMSRYPNWQGGLVQKNHPITAGDKEIGTVTISYYGPFYYSDNDILFLNTLNRIFIGVGIISLCFALVIGLLMAEGLSRPISKVINASVLISKGNYKNRIKEKSKIRELNELIDTVNNLAKALEDQEVLRKRITADVAHELRTPLATLQSHMEAIIDGVWEPSVDRIKSCHEETVRIKGLVGDLEKLAKFEGQNLIINKSEFNISEVINNIILNFEKEYMNKGIHINFNRLEKTITADKDKISQVIVNLLSNALKYTPDGGIVDISVQAEKQNTIISIRDNGIGISEYDLPHIFERFYRADKSRNRMTGGAGIGLTITKAIVEAHGGKIEVNSEINKGTEIKVIL
jgi:two-component system, OmpR family, sensor histidine kinase BaeS